MEGRWSSSCLRRGGLVVAAAVLVSACNGGDEAADRTTIEPVVVTAGMNDPDDVNIAVLEFLPESVTVVAGTAVTWRTPGPEPHTVTFLPAGRQAPPPGTPQQEALNEPQLPDGPYDGTATISSGLQPLGPEPAEPFEVTFSTPGEHRYFCAIHPLMTGTVTVVEEAGAADTADDIAGRAEAELEEWLAEGRRAKTELLARPLRSEPVAGGGTAWFVEMGVTTEHTDVLAFQPVTTRIGPGDRVTFVNNTGAPHTATFGPPDQLPRNPESPEARQASPGGSPQEVAAGAVMNTGWLPPDAPPGAGPPEEVRSFTVTFGAPGSYSYVCLLHVPSGMGGEVEVA